MRITIIGAGAGGQCMAADLSQKGHSISLYDVDRTKIAALHARNNRIALKGKLNGTADITIVTNDVDILRHEVAASELIMVVTTTDAHGVVANTIASKVNKSQTIVLNPGHCCGILEFVNDLKQAGVHEQEMPIIAECPTLIYGCKQVEPGEIMVTGIKKKILLSAFPKNNTEKTVEKLNTLYPQMKAASSMLETTFSVTGCLLHVIPTIMNVNKIDLGQKYEFYFEGITPHIAHLIEQADAERISVAEKYGVMVNSLTAWLHESYSIETASLYEMLQNNDSYRSIAGPKSLNHRFVKEDVMSGFVPIAALGDIAGVETPVIDLFISLSSYICQKDYALMGRSVEKIGLKGKTLEEAIDLMQK